LRATRLAGGDVALRFTLRNAGDRAGTEVTQVYAALPAATGEPPQRLVAFRRVSLAPGEARRVTLTVPAARFAVWDHGWQVPRGAARIIVGGSSRDPSALRTAVGLERQHLAHAQ
jgi:beta-glucosidase